MLTSTGLTGYFTACSAVAGTLVGLLFVAITLRYDAIFGAAARDRNRAVAAAAFTALSNALTVSLLALIPHIDLGWPAAIAAAFCFWSTLRTHVSRSGRRDTGTRLFMASMLLYVYQLAVGLILIANQYDTNQVAALAYIVFAAFSAALGRSWQLLQPESPPAGQS